MLTWQFLYLLNHVVKRSQESGEVAQKFQAFLLLQIISQALTLDCSGPSSKTFARGQDPSPQTTLRAVNSLFQSIKTQTAKICPAEKEAEDHTTESLQLLTLLQDQVTKSHQSHVTLESFFLPETLWKACLLFSFLLLLA